jgi:hypothetical protein
LERYLPLIKVWVPLVPADLLFNFDETGLSDWEERKPKPVLIPTTTGDSQLHYPVDRGIHHQRLLCLHFGIGECVFPFARDFNPRCIGGF